MCSSNGIYYLQCHIYIYTSRITSGRIIRNFRQYVVKTSETTGSKISKSIRHARVVGNIARNAIERICESP